MSFQRMVSSLICVRARLGPPWVSVICLVQWAALVRSFHWAAQATVISAPETNVDDALVPVVGLDHILDFIHALLPRVDLIVLPVVLAHQFGMRVQAGPLGSALKQDLLNVSIVHPSSSLELIES